MNKLLFSLLLILTPLCVIARGGGHGGGHGGGGHHGGGHHGGYYGGGWDGFGWGLGAGALTGYALGDNGGDTVIVQQPAQTVVQDDGSIAHVEQENKELREEMRALREEVKKKK